MAKGIKSSESDWLKYYCIVFGILILVVGFMYFKINGELEDYETANKQARNVFLNMKLLEDDRRDGNNVPITIPGLALDVKKYIDAYEGAVGGEEGKGISTTIVQAAATKAGLSQRNFTERQDDNPRGGFTTIYGTFQFDETRLENVVKFLYNIEQKRYRAYEVNWTLADGQSADSGPMNKVGKVTVRIGMRKPISTTQN